MVLLVLVTFLLSNRGPAVLSFWPFGFFATLPLGAVLIAVLVIGFFTGLAAHLPKRYTASRRLKKAQKRIAELEGKLAAPGPAAAVPASAGRAAPLITSGKPSTIRP